MVLRTVEPDSEEADGTRWSIMRTELPPDVLRNYWHAWVVGSWVSASASLFVIGVICSRPRLRSQAFNVFVVGLCIPDAVFSSMCGITCLLNYRAGEYYGGSDADARGENLENLRAMLAESDDDEGLPS